MGRGKRKKKAQLKRKRMSKMKKGKLIPFSLANSPHKMQGRTDKHDIKTNVHNLIYVGAHFENVKFTASNMTNCKFRDAKFVGVDFICTNLKYSKFKNVFLENVIFYGTNLKDVDFFGAHFKNVFFNNTNVSVAKNLDLAQPGIYVLNSNLSIEIDSSLQTAIINLMGINKIKKHYVLTTKSSNGKKVNKWVIYLLLKNFTSDELVKGFNRIYSNDKKNSNRTMMTYYSYLDFFCKYYRKKGII